MLLILTHYLVKWNQGRPSSYFMVQISQHSILVVIWTNSKYPDSIVNSSPYPFFPKTVHLIEAVCIRLAVQNAPELSDWMTVDSLPTFTCVVTRLVN